MAAATTMSAKEVAQEFGTDARTLRKFLREVTPKEDQPGQGGRWTFTKGEATKLRKKFDRWSDEGAKSTPAEPKAKRAKKETEAPPEPEEIDLDDEEILDLEDLDDPDEDELEDEDLGEDDD